MREIAHKMAVIDISKEITLSSADNLCKQFVPRSGPTKCRAWSGSKLFDTLMVFRKEILEKVNFEKNEQTTEQKKS